MILIFIILLDITINYVFWYNYDDNYQYVVVSIVPIKMYFNLIKLKLNITLFHIIRGLIPETNSKGMQAKRTIRGAALDMRVQT